jgi:uncharacterized membrane protein YhhN
MTHRLPARLFYGVVVMGVMLGALGCAAAGWWYLRFSEARPTGRRVWDGVAEEFVVPICVMIGATFGGLIGVAAAIALDRRVQRKSGS